MSSLQLDASIWKLLTIILIMLMGGCIGVITYFLKDIRGQLKEKLSEHSGRIDALRNDLNDLEKSLPRTYLHRDDWLRDQVNMDKRMEDMAKSIAELNRNVLKAVQSDGG